MIERTVNVEKTVYISVDGKEFQDKKRCLMHEAEIYLEGIEDKPYKLICDNELVRWVDEYLDIISPESLEWYSYTKIYAAEIRREEDSMAVEQFCISKDGEELCHWAIDFPVGGKYLICVVSDDARMLGVEYRVKTIKYRDFLDFYRSRLSSMESIFSLTFCGNDAEECDSEPEDLGYWDMVASEIDALKESPLEIDWIDPEHCLPRFDEDCVLKINMGGDDISCIDGVDDAYIIASGYLCRESGNFRLIGQAGHGCDVSPFNKVVGWRYIEV